ncbi:methyl-accepting chemotaxis protein [Lachnospiraceae bacterium KM106-2]|nr:methyl-accepting chemotaxis protein [Lachnospiraceae bacterium KM106-2]
MIPNSDKLLSCINSNGTKNTTEASNYISQLMGSYEDIESVQLINNKGVVIYSSDSTTLQTDLSKETYISSLISDNSTTQSDAFKSESSNDMCISFGIPLKNMAMQGDRDRRPDNDQASKDDSKNTNDTKESQESQEFQGGIIVTTKTSALTSSISSMKLSNLSSSSTMLIDANGTILYQEDSSLIGTEVASSELKNIAQSMSKLKDSKTITYTYNGTTKYAAYKSLNNSKWMLILNTDKIEVLSSVTDVAYYGLYLALGIIAVFIILAYLLAKTITTPIIKIKKSIDLTAELNLSSDTTTEQLSKRKDEIGEMARSINKMKETLHDMVKKINHSSSTINDTATELITISNTVNQHTNESYTIMEDLSASMEETSATTEVICENISHIQMNSTKISEMAEGGNQLSAELSQKAQALSLSTADSVTSTKELYQQIKERTAIAVAQSKAIDQIDVLTKTIMDIADQTSLLSLNAEIEAARAGDAGKGFAVVANEIGHLAEESTNTVNNIRTIVSEIVNAVDEMRNTLDTTNDFLEKNVITDYNQFLVASDSYNKDALSMNQFMHQIHSEITTMNGSMTQMNESINEISNRVNEVTHGIIEVSEKNSTIVSLTDNTLKQAKESQTNGSILNDLVKQFNL